MIIKKNNVTTIDNIEEAREFIEKRRKEKQIKKNLLVLQRKVDNLIEYAQQVSTLQNELGIYSTIINNEGKILHTVLTNGVIEPGLAIRINDYTFRIIQDE